MKPRPENDRANPRSRPYEGTRGSTQSNLRAHNERLVLTVIRQVGPMAKADIARLTRLSAQTVSVIMRELEAEGLLKKGKPVRGKVGQPSVPMDLDAGGAYFLGLKVGRRSVDLILTDFRGSIVRRNRMTHRYPDPDNVVRFANDSIEQILGTLTAKQRARVAGLGIAIPFRMWNWAKALGVGAEDLAGWRDRDIAAEIADRWDFPVYLRNDASAACGAELVFGDQNRPGSFLYFFIGFFVGGGLVLDNALFTGRTGNAAALGPLPVGIQGDTVKQLVDVASLVVLEQALVNAGLNESMIWDTPDAWDIPDDILAPWIGYASEGLAHAIMASACVIDFECVVIDGWLPPAVRAEIVQRTSEKLSEIIDESIDTPDIRAGSIGSDARSLGAASLPLSDRFLVDKNSFLKG